MGNEQILVLSAATACVSFTVSETKLFLPLREWLQKNHLFLGNLFSCGYCFGHWVSFALVAIYTPRLLHQWWLLDYFLTSLVIAWLSAFQWIALCLLLKWAGK